MSKIPLKSSVASVYSQQLSNIFHTIFKSLFSFSTYLQKYISTFTRVLYQVIILLQYISEGNFLVHYMHLTDACTTESSLKILNMEK